MEGEKRERGRTIRARDGGGVKGGKRGRGEGKGEREKGKRHREEGTMDAYFDID